MNDIFRSGIETPWVVNGERIISRIVLMWFGVFYLFFGKKSPPTLTDCFTSCAYTQLRDGLPRARQAGVPGDLELGLRAVVRVSVGVFFSNIF